MRVVVGLTDSSLKTLDHRRVAVALEGSCKLYRCSGPLSAESLAAGSRSRRALIVTAAAGRSVTAEPVAGGGLKILVAGKPIGDPWSAEDWLLLEPVVSDTKLTLSSVKRYGARGRVAPGYRGALAVYLKNGQTRLALALDLDDYLRGVLKSEIPASYHLEAIKCQAVAARTYALSPRIDHRKDAVNVCDSYHCCQYFGGLSVSITPRHQKAILATAGQVLVYDDAPILALFSSCAGGHTESYENCFSNPVTHQFPDKPRPYLRGVPEYKSVAPRVVVDESYLRRLYGTNKPETVDAWSNHFKWRIAIGADRLESHLHHTIDKLRRDRGTAPFIVPAASNGFGHIKGFRVAKRGVAGTAIELVIETTEGDWLVRKELVIRDLFKIPARSRKSRAVPRLKSARLFFDQKRDRQGLLSRVTISGLGWGHGVGMQQTGAQGWARQGQTYRDILRHYYPGSSIERA